MQGKLGLTAACCVSVAIFVLIACGDSGRSTPDEGMPDAGAPIPDEGTPVVRDSCNGVDDDADAVVDEDAACRPASGEVNSACIDGRCVGDCAPGRVHCGSACVFADTFSQCEACNPCEQGQVCASGACVDVSSLVVQGELNTSVSVAWPHPSGWVISGRLGRGATIGPAVSMSRGMYVTLMDSTATPAWTTFGTIPTGGNNAAHVSGLTVVGTDVFVTGGSQGTPFTLGSVSKTGPASNTEAYLARLNATGDTQWLTDLSLPGYPWFSSGTGVVPYGSGIAVSAHYNAGSGGTSSMVNTVTVAGVQGTRNTVGEGVTVPHFVGSGSSLWVWASVDDYLFYGGMAYTALDNDHSFVVRMSGTPLTDGTTAHDYGVAGVRAIETNGTGGYFAWLSSGHLVSSNGATETWRVAASGLTWLRLAAVGGRLFVAMEGSEAASIGTVSFRAHTNDRIILAELDPDNGTIVSSAVLALGGTLELQGLVPAADGESLLLFGNPSGTLPAANVSTAPTYYQGVALVVPTSVLLANP
ncbi:MAG: hypothetical protein H6725_05750 [Sandaracinaceae bacterium]|nr:hypothetical protein [Sandaracinaceae bacterium]